MSFSDGSEASSLAYTYQDVLELKFPSATSLLDTLKVSTGQDAISVKTVRGAQLFPRLAPASAWKEKISRLGEVKNESGAWHLSLGKPEGGKFRIRNVSNSSSELHIFVTNTSLKKSAESEFSEVLDGQLRVECSSYACDVKLDWKNGPASVACVKIPSNGLKAACELMADKDKPISVIFTLGYTIHRLRHFPFHLLSPKSIHLITGQLSLLDIHRLGQAVPSFAEQLSTTTTNRFTKLFSKPSLLYRIILKKARTVALLHVCHLGETAPSFAPHTSAEATRRVTAVFAKYFSKPRELDRILEKTGAVVSGSSVLSVLAPGRWTPGDLDFVVGLAESAELHRYLLLEGYKLHEDGIRVEGLHEDDENDERANYYLWVMGEQSLFSLKSYKKGGRKIDVSIPKSQTPINFIFAYHCTAVMNYYTPGELKNRYCTPEQLAPGVEKYQVGGFVLANPECVQDSNTPPRGHFEIGQGRGWYMTSDLLRKAIWRVKIEL